MCLIADSSCSDQTPPDGANNADTSSTIYLVRLLHTPSITPVQQHHHPLRAAYLHQRWSATVQHRQLIPTQQPQLKKLSTFARSSGNSGYGAHDSRIERYRKIGRRTSGASRNTGSSGKLNNLNVVFYTKTILVRAVAATISACSTITIAISAHSILGSKKSQEAFNQYYEEQLYPVPYTDYTTQPGEGYVNSAQQLISLFTQTSHSTTFLIESYYILKANDGTIMVVAIFQKRKMRGRKPQLESVDIVGFVLCYFNTNDPIYRLYSILGVAPSTIHMWLDFHLKVLQWIIHQNFIPSFSIKWPSEDEIRESSAFLETNRGCAFAVRCFWDNGWRANAVSEIHRPRRTNCDLGRLHTGGRNYNVFL